MTLTATDRRPRALAVGLLALVAAACSGGDGGPSTPAARPSSTATLTIASPANGDVINGPTVAPQISLEGAEITDRVSTDLEPDEGHIHVYLDDVLAAQNYTLGSDLTDVGPGMHVLRVEFVALDHAPFNPRVFAQVTFEVRA